MDKYEKARRETLRRLNAAVNREPLYPAMKSVKPAAEKSRLVAGTCPRAIDDFKDIQRETKARLKRVVPTIEDVQIETRSRLKAALSSLSRML